MSENLIDNHRHYHHVRVFRGPCINSAWTNYPFDKHDDRDFVMFTFDIIEITLKANVISSTSTLDEETDFLSLSNYSAFSRARNFFISQGHIG